VSQPRRLSKDTPESAIDIVNVVSQLHPSVVLAAAEVISTFAKIEAEWTILLAALTKTDAELVAGMLDAVVNPRAKVDVIRSAAKVALVDSPNDLALCNRALDEWLRANRQVRRPYAHDIWCFVKTEPMSLVLLPTKDAARFEVAQFARSRDMMDAVQRTPAVDIHMVAEHGCVYDLAVILTHVKQALSLMDAVLLMSVLFRETAFPADALRNSIRGLLPAPPVPASSRTDVSGSHRLAAL